jgi:hypothetical protein
MTIPAPSQPEPPEFLEPPDKGHAIPASGTGRAADVIDLIMADHRRIRRLRAALSDTVRCASDFGPRWAPDQVWHLLTGLLITHFQAEEEICYLPMFGPGPEAAERRHEAVADHDDIREAIGEASLQRPGSALWWHAVRAALSAVIDHLDREESGVLADCLSRLTMSQRLALGHQWVVFTAASAQDVQRMADGAAPAPQPASPADCYRPAGHSDTP